MFGLPTEVILTLGSGIGGFIMKYLAQKSANQQKLLEMSIARGKAIADLQDRAAKRSSPLARKILAFIVILICFGGILTVAFFPDIPVSIVEDPQRHSILWGLISWTKTNVISANGLVFPDWVRYTICSIIGFFYGSGGAKANR